MKLDGSLNFTYLHVDILFINANPAPTVVALDASDVAAL